MDMLKLLSTIDALGTAKAATTPVQEAKKETKTGIVHKAEPGGYGRAHDEDEGDEDDKKAKKAKRAAAEPKRGRGRPKKDTTPGGDRGPKWSDTAKQFFGVPKKDFDPKKLPGKASVKHTLKDWIEEINGQMITEAPVVAPMKIGDKVVQATITPKPGDRSAEALAQALKTSAASGGIAMSAADADAASGTNAAKTGATAAAKPAGAVASMTTEVEEPQGRQPGFMRGARVKPTRAFEGRDPYRAAYHEGRSHAAEGMGYKCRYDEGSTEHRAYHEGYCEGINECWGKGVYEGQMDESPMAMGVARAAAPAAASAAGRMMATDSLGEDDLEEVSRGEWIKQQDAKAERAGKKHFKAFGQTFDTDKVDETYMDEDDSMDGWMAEDDVLLNDDEMDEGAWGEDAVMDDADMYEDMTDEEAMFEGKSGAKFKKLKAKLSKRGDIKDPAALAASIGRKKYGKAKFQKMAAAGKKARTDESAFSEWEGQLQSLLAEDGASDTPLQEGLTVSTSTGQTGVPDSVSITANGEDAGQLMRMLQNSGIGIGGGLPKAGQQSPMTHVRGDVETDGELNMAAQAVRTMPAGSGMSATGDYEQEECEPIEPYSTTTVIDALRDGGSHDSHGGNSSGDRLGSLRDRLMALEAKDLVQLGGKRAGSLPMPEGEGMSVNVEEEGRDAVEAVERESVEGALHKHGKHNGPKADGGKSIYKEEAERLGADTKAHVKDPNTSTQNMRMPAGKGFSTAPTEKSEEIAEPTTPEAVDAALAKDAKAEQSADRDFAAIMRMLKDQGMTEPAKKKSKVAEGKNDDTSADSGNIPLSMPLGKGMSTNPTEKGREAPQPQDIDSVQDAMEKDAQANKPSDDSFKSLKALIAKHIKMPSGDNVGPGADDALPQQPESDAAAADNDFENGQARASERGAAAERDVAAIQSKASGGDSEEGKTNDSGSDSNQPPQQKAKKVEEDETDAQRAYEVAEARGMKRFCKECGTIMREGHTCEAERLDEWANTLAPDHSSYDESFTTGYEFTTKTISGGLNGMKRNQTTLPKTEVVPHDDALATLREWVNLIKHR